MLSISQNAQLRRTNCTRQRVVAKPTIKYEENQIKNPC